MTVFYQLLAYTITIGSSVSAAELRTVPGADIFLFSGRAGSILIPIQNRSDEPITALLDYRIFQASSSTLAPVGDKATLPNISFASGITATIPLPFTPPQVHGITPFVVKVFSSESEIGAVNFTVVPSKVFTRLTGLGLKQIYLHEPSLTIRPLLEESGLEIGEEATAETSVLIVHLPSATAELDWHERRVASAAPTLFILGRGVTGAEKLLPTKFVQKEGRRMLLIQEWFLPDLKVNALSQLRLLRGIQLLCKPELEPDPSFKSIND